MLHASGLFAGFIGASSPAASVEGAPAVTPLAPLAQQNCTTTAGFLHTGILPLPEAPALVRGSGVSFSRWCSWGVLSLTMYSGVWVEGIG
jgi:hypothetical protein